MLEYSTCPIEFPKAEFREAKAISERSQLQRVLFAFHLGSIFSVFCSVIKHAFNTTSGSTNNCQDLCAGKSNGAGVRGRTTEEKSPFPVWRACQVSGTIPAALPCVTDSTRETGHVIPIREMEMKSQVNFCNVAPLVSSEPLLFLPSRIVTLSNSMYATLHHQEPGGRQKVGVAVYPCSLYFLLMSPGGGLSPYRWKTQSTLGQRDWGEPVPHMIPSRKQP